MEVGSIRKNARALDSLNRESGKSKNMRLQLLKETDVKR